jgi:hypothetical protein
MHRTIHTIKAAFAEICHLARRAARPLAACALLAAVAMQPQPAQAAGDKSGRFTTAASLTNDLAREVTAGTLYLWQENSAYTQTFTVTRYVITDNSAFNTNAGASVTNTVTLGSVTVTGIAHTNLALNYPWPDSGRLLITATGGANTNTFVITRPESD